MPSHQGGRREHQAASGQVACHSGQDHPVYREEVRALYLATEDGDLVAKREDLDIELSVRCQSGGAEADDQSDQGIQGREEHEGGP